MKRTISRATCTHDELDTIITAAWEWLWAYYQGRIRESMAEGHEPWDDHFFITASELEYTVRIMLANRLRKQPATTGDPAYGNTHGLVVSIRGGRYREDLLCVVRDWLAGQTGDTLQRHNFGKGHISGMRYRPLGAPLSPAEKRTLAKKDKDATRAKAIHAADPATHWPQLALCSKAARETAKAKRRSYSCRRHSPHSSVSTTSDPDKVTCPKCRKLLGQANTQADN